MLRTVRWAVYLAVFSACNFTHGGSPGDAPPDTIDAPPDAPIVPTWSVDSKSGKGVPTDTNQWAKLVVAYGLPTAAPDHLWLMQESSGSLGDVVSGATLAVKNNPTYSNAVTGWSRNAVATPDVTNDEGFQSTTLGNLDGTSYALLLYVAIGAAPGVERSVCGIGAGNDHRYVAITPTPRYKATGLGSVVPTTGLANPSTTVHPVLLKVDETHQSYVVYTDIEKLPVTWVATGGLGPLLVIGSASVGSANTQYLYGALWSGAHAELDDAAVKKLLQGLGWTVTGF
jgi:hypothetical protein